LLNENKINHQAFGHPKKKVAILGRAYANSRAKSQAPHNFNIRMDSFMAGDTFDFPINS